MSPCAAWAGSGARTRPAAPRPGPRRAKERLYANPTRAGAHRAGAWRQLEQADGALTAAVRERLAADADALAWRSLRVGSRVVAGTVLGRAGRSGSGRPVQVRLELRASGGEVVEAEPAPAPAPPLAAPRAPAPALAPGGDALPAPGEDAAPVPGRAIPDAALDDRALARAVLADPRIAIYACGRADVAAGIVDRRVLLVLRVLADSGLHPTVSSLRCGHSYLTASGRVSHHSVGAAVDISAVNGVPVLGHQGPGSVTDRVVRRLLALPAELRAVQIVSLLRYPGEPTTLALADHADHVHVGFGLAPPGPR